MLMPGTPEGPTPSPSITRSCGSRTNLYIVFQAPLVVVQPEEDGLEDELQDYELPEEEEEE